MGLELAPTAGDKQLTARQALLLGTLMTGALFGLYEIGSDQKDREITTEDCVGELVGRTVNLVTDPRTGRLQRPASVYEEISVCLEADGDAAQAEILLDE